MPLIDDLRKDECTGCGACKSICPTACIDLQFDEEGFLSPIVGESCTECGRCSGICPIIVGCTEMSPDIVQHAVAARSYDTKLLDNSSSGGAFSEICYAFGDERTIVFGARFDGLKVVHSYVEGIAEIGCFRKSKYVQSDIGDCFCKAKDFLDAGKNVIFSGTPCQIAGLRSFLQKVYDNLLCIDFICHGVGSPKVFESAIAYMEERLERNIVQYSFRNQMVTAGNRRDYICCYEFDNGERMCFVDDVYQSLFLSQLCLRASCGENCKFRNKNRLGDLTIADLKAKHSIFPYMIDNRNYSTIAVNSKKGEMVLAAIGKQMKMYPLPMSAIKKYNPLFFETTKGNSNRDLFFEDFVNSSDFGDVFPKYVSKEPRRLVGPPVKDYILPYVVRRCGRIAMNLLGGVIDFICSIFGKDR